MAPSQVTGNAASASEVFTLIDARKNTTSASRSGSRPSWTLVGVGCSNTCHAILEDGTPSALERVEAYSYIIRQIQSVETVSLLKV